MCTASCRGFLWCLFVTLLWHASCLPALCSTICYIRGGKIFTVSTGHHGASGTSHFLYDLNKSNLVLDNCVLLGRNKQTGSVLFTYDDEANEEVWSIGNGRLSRIVTNADDPVISPDGTEIAYLRGRDACIYDERTGRTRTVADDASEIAWAHNCSELALIIDSEDPDFRSPVEILNEPTLSVLFKKNLFNPDAPFLSPLGSYLAVVPHMSRPVQGDTVLPVKGDPNSAIVNQDFTPDKYLQGTVEDWSTDEHWILWDWRTPDPKNSGVRLGDNVGLTSLDGKFRHDLGPGEGATFCSRDTTVYFLRMKGKVTLSPGSGNTNLMAATAPTWTPHVLIRNVDDYMVY